MTTRLPLESLLRWLAGIVAITVGLLMPALYLVVSYQSRVGEMEGEARIAALAVTEFVNTNAGLWEFQQERLNGVLRKVVATHHSVQVVAADGRVIAGIGPAIAAHTVSRFHEFHDYGRVAGRVGVHVSVGEILGGVGWLVLAGGVIGLVVFFPLRNLPLKALQGATQALRESEERNRTVVASLSEGVMMVDREGRLLSVNEAARALFGASLEPWLSRRDMAVTVRDAEGNRLGDADHPIARTFASCEAQRHAVLQVEQAEGVSVWLQVNTQPLRDSSSGVVSAVVVSVIDISEDRQREEELGRARDAAEAASRAKSQFLANMSHEIRTPMNGVLGMAQLLAMDSSLKAEQRRYLQIIQSSGESLLRVIDDILDFSKMEAGRLSLAEEDFDLQERLSMTLRLMEMRAQAKSLELTWSVADDVPHWLKGDSARLHQVLTNLIGNAVKFTERGSVHVKVEPAADPHPAGGLWRLRFSVGDTGIGIPAQYLPRLFNAFSQADASNSRRFGGTGLGLSISRQLVELMGGEMGVESEPGQGSTFWFTVLMHTAENEGETSLATLPDELAKNPPALVGRVLVVEDEPTNRLLAKAMLRVLGCTSEAVEEGQEALDWLDREQCDLILMDCQMPGLDGFETTARIREQEIQAGKDGRHIPIVAMTANALSGDRERCLRAGMDDYLSKPYTTEDLRAKLLRWLPAGSRGSGQLPELPPTA